VRSLSVLIYTYNLIVICDKWCRPIIL